MFFPFTLYTFFGSLKHTLALDARARRGKVRKSFQYTVRNGIHSMRPSSRAAVSPMRSDVVEFRFRYNYGGVRINNCSLTHHVAALSTVWLGHYQHTVI